MNVPVAKMWTFRSTSNPSKLYQTLLRTDGMITCNCPGWTKRVDSKGNRSCRHTRSVEMGTAETECVAFKDNVTGETSKKTTIKKAPAKKKISKKKEPVVPVVHRRVQWKD